MRLSPGVLLPHCCPRRGQDAVPHLHAAEPVVHLLDIDVERDRELRATELSLRLLDRLAVVKQQRATRLRKLVKPCDPLDRKAAVWYLWQFVAHLLWQFVAHLPDLWRIASRRWKSLACRRGHNDQHKEAGW